MSDASFDIPDRNRCSCIGCEKTDITLYSCFHCGEMVCGECKINDLCPECHEAFENEMEND